MTTGEQFVLLIDTCGAVGSVALATIGTDPRVVGASTLPGRAASERLVPSIKELLLQQGIALERLGAVAVVHGPGSFTGLRVGLSAAKGLCEARGIPLIAISRLAILASLAAQSEQPGVLALLDAGRGEFYAGHYLAGTCQGEFLRRGEQLKEMLEGDPGLALVVCEPAVAERVGEYGPLVVGELKAADALTIAVRRLEMGAFDDPSNLDANYVRNSDSEIFAKPARLIPTHA